MIFDKLGKLVTESGFVQIVTSPDGWKALVMIALPEFRRLHDRL